MLETSGRRMLANAELKHMVKATVPLLKAFIFVRSHDKGNAVARLSKPKGGIEDAVPGADTLLRVAFDLRSQGVKLKPVSAQPQQSDAPALVPACTFVQIDGRLGAGTSIKDNRFVVTQDFVKQVKKALDPYDAHPLNTSSYADGIPHSIQQRADLLHEILHARLVRHIQDRVCLVDDSKRNHYCLRWVKQNLGHVAAIMVIMNHTKDDLAMAKSNTGACLLRQPREARSR